MAIQDILFDVAPEFASEDPEKLERFIGYAAEDVNREALGKKADRATAYLAAHMLTLAARKGANQGAVVKERVGDLERGYAAPSSSGDAHLDAYKATSYGVEFLRLDARKSGKRPTPLVL
ncbi:hypothetical protein D3C72_718850 [compost metagenome]